MPATSVSYTKSSYKKGDQPEITTSSTMYAQNHALEVRNS